MPFSCLPTIIIDSVTQLTEAYLRSRDIQLLMLDFDNTIVPYTTDTPTGEMDAWLKRMLASSVRLCVVSNSRNDRVKRFCQSYGLDCITHAQKPFSRGIRECLEKYGLDKAQCALAGDQIFTDTMGARCAGIRAILVKPIHNHNFWLKARHVLEQPFILISGKRRVQL